MRMLREQSLHDPSPEAGESQTFPNLSRGGPCP